MSERSARLTLSVWLLAADCHLLRTNDWRSEWANEWLCERNRRNADDENEVLDRHSVVSFLRSIAIAISPSSSLGGTDWKGNDANSKECTTNTKEWTSIVVAYVNCAWVCVFMFHELITNWWNAFVPAFLISFLSARLHYEQHRMIWLTKNDDTYVEVSWVELNLIFGNVKGIGFHKDWTTTIENYFYFNDTMRLFRRA